MNVNNELEQRPHVTERKSSLSILSNKTQMKLLVLIDVLIWSIIPNSYHIFCKVSRFAWHITIICR